MTAPVDPVRADRDAAADYLEAKGDKLLAFNVRAGNVEVTFGVHRLVQAFARHRSEAESRARREAYTECAKLATSFLVGDPANGIPLRNPMAHEIADAITKRRDG